MDKITRILEKLNQQRSGETVTLADFMPMSLAEVRSLAGGRLSREEAQLLHRAAIKEQQNNILYTARALTRANPLLKKEMGAARTYGATPYGYNDIIMPRADEFAAPGAVSSMFSPAGYLTELYREARGLHQKDSVNNLDKRRPDLAKLVLSQENLDKEISTLSLANEQLETALMAQAGQTDKSKYYESLATSRRSGVTPYNAPFEGIRNALAQQDFVLPDHVLSKGAESAAQMALYAGISPELYAILTEKTDGLSEAETEALLKKNFPGVNTESLMNLDVLANYYELPRDEIQALLEITIPHGSSLKDTRNLYGENKTQIIKARDTDGDVFYTLTHTGLKNEALYNTILFEYIDLIPLNNNQFLINFSVNALNAIASGLHIGIPTSTSNYPEDLYSDSTVNIEKGKHYSIPVTINAEIIPEVTISVSTYVKGRWYGHSTFAVTKTIVPLLLTLNKILRLAKACGITPLEAQRALTRLNTTGKLSDAAVLHRFCEFLLYRKRYNISSDDALILSGANISTVSHDGQLSQFDRMFNNPPLNGVTYTLDDSYIMMKPDAKDPRREVLKRAFRVDNTGLWQLFNIHDRTDIDDTAGNRMNEIKGIYLARLLADVHNLTVAQLNALLLVSTHRTTRLYMISDQKRRELITFLYQTTQWLNTQNITVEQLYLLLTREAPAVPTKEMATLLDALRNGGIDSTNTDTLRTTMAPVIAAAMQIDSPEQGEALLHWLDKNHPDNMLTTDKIWPLITAENPSADQQKQLAAWCQALAQRVLVIRTFALSNAELQILSQGAPAGTIAALREISDFHDLINRCGEQAGAVLDALQSNTLSTALLAGALNLSEYVITQALTQAGQSTSLTSWKQLAALPSRLDLADNLLITPKDITNLLTVSDNSAPSYTDLTTLAGLLQAGLNEQQTTQLQNQSEPRRSEALSGEYRALVMGKPLANRDDIWRKLL
ncbi:insecticidal toxin protein, partial [Morganella morganii subsp. morganii]|uniref:Tc toxin subunit A n=1 Tax=Morganella morganii TaxID=582 RepID=UPI002024F398